MKRSHPKHASNTSDAVGAEHGGSVGHEIDRYRSILFPNNVRHLRKRHGHAKLLGLSSLVPEIPYIRLSKIERGEVFAKAEELRRIAAALKVEPDQLLIDVDARDFDIATWAADLQDWEATDAEQDRFAVELAAAIRARREGDKHLSIVAIERDYGIAPVILSRLENAYKTFDRWNAQTTAAVCRLFGARNAGELHDHVVQACASGSLAPYLELIANPAIRIAKTRARVAALREELDGPAAGPRAKGKVAQPRRVDGGGELAHAAPSPSTAAMEASDIAMVRLVPVFGAPLADGLIDRSPTDETVEAPRRAGHRAYGLRVCRPTLGPGLPANAVAVVDPDRFPSSGGIAVLSEGDGLRLLTVTFDRHGKMVGYSANPDREVALDDVDPAAMASVVSIVLD